MLLYESISQPLNFLYILLIGFASGLIFDFFKYLNFLCNKNTITEKIFDFLSVAICGVVFFLAELHLNYGEFRFYLLFGFIVGILLERFSLGLFIAKICSYCYNKLTTVLNKIWKKKIKEELTNESDKKSKKKFNYNIFR